jgi:hypothetical protein
MSWVLTTTHENGIFRGVAMSLGTPRRMKMTSRCPATKQTYRLTPKGLIARSCFTWYRAPAEEGFSTEYPRFFATASFSHQPTRTSCIEER